MLCAITLEMCLSFTRWTVHRKYKYISTFNTLKPRWIGQDFEDDIFKRIFFKENVWVLIIISLKFVSKCPINSIPALARIVALRGPGDDGG